MTGAGGRARVARLVGARVRGGSPWRVVQSAFVAVAAAVLTLSFVAVAVVVAQYAGSESVAQARGLRWPDLFPGEPVVALWAQHTAVLESGQQAALVALAAITEDPLPPPGVAVWPGPGQMVVSPAWERHVADLPFGHLDADVVGIIGPEGLIDAGEIIAYIGGEPEQVARAGGEEITGFGSERSPRIGTHLYRQPVWWLLLPAGILLVAPAGFLLVTAFRMGAGARARREEILAHLGVPEHLTAQIRLGEVSRPILVGGGVAAVISGLLLVIDLHLPGAGFTVRAADNLTLWWALSAAVALGVLTSWLLARSRIGLRAERATAQETAPARALVDALLAPCAAAAVVIGLNISELHHHEMIVLTVFWGGIIAVMALLPRSVRGWLSWIYPRLERRASEAGNPAWMVASAQVIARPRPYGRFGAVAASAIVLLALVGRFAMLWGSDMAEAQAPGTAVTREVGAVGIPFSAWRVEGNVDTVIADTSNALSDDFYVVGLNWDRDTVTGSVEDLAAFGFRAGQAGTHDPGFAAALGERGWTAPTIDAQAAELGGEDTARLLLRTRDGGAIDRTAVDAALADVMLPPLRVTFADQTATLGAAVNLHQARWLEWFGTLGMFTLVAALWAGFSNELLRMRRNLLPAQVLAPDRRFTWAATWVRIVVPCIVFTVVGSALAVLITLPLMNLGTTLITPPWTWILTASAIVIGSGLVAWIVLARNIATRSMRLRFGQSPD